MSHITGSVQPVAPAIGIGPDFGPATNPPDTWALDFAHTPAPMGTRLVMLHFTGASFPANNRLEVDLGYGGELDVFTAADGTDFWTRPIRLNDLPGEQVPIRYITNGAATGGVQLVQYGRGERHTKDPENPGADFNSFTNCDPFLKFSPFIEPQYATHWFCNIPPHWENFECAPPLPDIRSVVAPSVGMILHVDFNTVLADYVMSTCTVTLVEPDVIVTAGHCMTDPIEDARSASVIFNYQTHCDGSNDPGYMPVVVKVKEVIRQRFADGTASDYCLIRLVSPVPGITPRPMRMDLPAIGEPVFCIHYPNGAVKKLSPLHPGFALVTASGTTAVQANMDITGGSSGSALFDSVGRVVGVLAGSSPCNLGYFPTATMLQDIAAPTPITRDVMIVFDRSGSMSLPGTSGMAKIAEARAAASLFVQLLRAGTGNRVGLVSFSSAASMPVDFTLANVTAANKTALIGPMPFTTGVVGNLMPGGSTSMGSGLNAAFMQLTPMGNPRNVLLLTDGLQNTPPMVDPNSKSPTDITIDVIGYGTPASLDGPMLTAVAMNHNGQYVMADTNLKLQKFFALAFGNIFEAGLLMDPEFVLPAGVPTAPPLPFDVCEEETLTVVVGWDHPDTHLLVEVTTPSGAPVTAALPGVESAMSRTWTFLRVPLPQAGERDGRWHVHVSRPQAGITAAAGTTSGAEVRYFVNVIADGGAVLRRMPDRRRYHTGDAINPLVALQYLKGGAPPNAKVRVIVRRPDTAVGTLLSRETLGGVAVIDADTIPPRQATLLAIEKKTGKPVVGYTELTFDLESDVESTGSFEPGDLFGKPMNDLLTVEGNYTFHAHATYGDGCIATREVMWSVHVDPGIDPGKTDMTVTGSGGQGVIVIVPRDIYGNNLGPGRGGDITITGAPGTTVTEPPADNGDGSYSVHVTWNSASGAGPGVIIAQPGRPPVVVGAASGPAPGPSVTHGGHIWKWLCCVLAVLLAIVLVLWLCRYV
ncbi:MAG: trypsin-like peptidase domain-containing protein [Candidatus Kapaibacterium sp.]